MNQNRFEWELTPPHSIFGVHVPAVSEFLPSRQRWVARPCSRGGKQRRGNFIEMAEGATTLKGLRAQMGKLKTEKKTSSNAVRSFVIEQSSRFVTCADKCRLPPGSCWNELLPRRAPGATDASSLSRGCLPTMDAENVSSESNHKSVLNSAK